MAQEEPAATTATELDDTTDTNSGGGSKLFKHNAKDFEMGNILGDGAFGKVVVGTVINQESPYYNQKFAIKIMDKRHIVKNKKIKYVNIEKSVFLKTKAHPFICHMHFSYQDPYSLFMVLDLCTDDTLSFLIYKYIQLSEEVTKIYSSELISCLEYMHSLGIYHRDVKPENVLIGFDGHIRLTDFGTAKVIDMDDEKQVQAAKEKQEKGVQSDSDAEDDDTQNQTDLNKDENNTNQDNVPNEQNKNLKVNFDQNRDRKQSFVGTAQYVPPEMLTNKPYSFAGMDFWAVGCLIYQCLVGKPPFSASNEYLTFKKIESMEYDLPDTLSANATDIITKFLNPTLESRLGMDGYEPIRNHEFFSSMPWDWEEMKKQSVPMRPPTPAASPVKLDPNRHGRSSSAWNELENLKDVKVQNVSLDSGDRQSGGSSNNNLDTAGNSGSGGVLTRMNTAKNNEALFERWKKFLNKNEQIEFGSAVSQSKMFGMQTDRSVMLLTNEKRLLLIDGTEMKLKKDISTNSIKSIEVNDTSSITIRLQKKSMKLKITGQTSERWKDAIELVMNSK